MRMNSTENPLLDCNAEKTDLDFDAIVREIAGKQEAVKKSIDEIDGTTEDRTTPDGRAPGGRAPHGERSILVHSTT